MGSGPAPGKATQSHSPAARRPPRPSDGPEARGGSAGPSAADTPALAPTPAASASLSLCRPPSARTRPQLTSPRGLGSRQGQGMGNSLKSLRRSQGARATPVNHNSLTGTLGPPQALRTREATTPAFRRLRRLCRGRLEVTVRTRAEPQAVPFHLALWTPTASVRETLLDAPPLSLTHFPDLGRMRV